LPKHFARWQSAVTLSILTQKTPGSIPLKISNPLWIAWRRSDKPLVVQKQGMIVRKDNGRLMAAKRLGWERIAALDEDDVAAAARAIADNRAAVRPHIPRQNVAKGSKLRTWHLPQLQMR
jgi:hypothetical protein